MIKNIKLLLLVVATFVACENDEEIVQDNNSSDGQPLTSGSTDFSKYVAIGDSFAAGFSDGALFIEGQKGSYPNILAEQFALVGGGAFSTPFMADNIGGFSGSSIYTPRLFFNTATSTPNPVSGISSTSITDVLSGTFNNMGIPGAKSFHLLFQGYGSSLGNPYFARFASSPSTTVIADALSQNPTFFSLWIGGNDVLGYATNGGDPSNPITPITTFETSYNTLTSQLSANGRKGVVANLPYITTLPYFYVIKYNQLTQANLTKPDPVDPTIMVNQVNNLNTNLYGPLKNALTYLGEGNRINLLSTTGNNPMLMVDENLTNISTQLGGVLTQGLILQGMPVPQATATGTFLGSVFGQARQTTPSDLICLSASSRIGKEPTVEKEGFTSPSSDVNLLGVTYPLPDKYVLLTTEVQEIKDATDSYNLIIENAANSNNLAFVDAKAIMNELNGPTGKTSNGFTLTTKYVTGGAFSLDGIHPSPRGYALIANEFVKVINSKYGSNLKGVDLGNYRILFPASL